jgi:hypothetical protein
MLRAPRPALVILAIAACGDAAPGGAGGGGHGGDAALPSSASARAASGAGGGVPRGPIVVAPTRGRLALPFDASVQGAGSRGVGAIALSNGVGGIELAGANLPLVVHARPSCGDASPCSPAFQGYAILQGLAVAADRLHPVWLYCQADVLASVQHESTAAMPLTLAPATGACALADAPVTATVSLPPIAMPFPSLVPGYTIDGPAIAYDGAQPGSLRLGGVTYAFLPFAEIDCAACGNPGWRELHTLLWDGARVCFTVVYVFDGAPVRLGYALCLPTLEDPIGWLELDATVGDP